MNSAPRKNENLGRATACFRYVGVLSSGVFKGGPCGRNTTHLLFLSSGEGLPRELYRDLASIHNLKRLLAERLSDGGRRRGGRAGIGAEGDENDLGSRIPSCLRTSG